jgi:type I restriction enzyme S subunit
MKEGWEIKTLGEVCKTSSGGTPLKTNKSFYSNPTIPWLLSGEVRDKELHHSINYISEEGLKGSSAKIFPPNTVLVAMYGATAGQSSILRFESSTNQAICGILPSSHLLAEFIYYYFNFFKENLIAQATGNAQPNISQEKIKNIRIPIPPLLEQQRIVSIIDKAFEAIDKAIENTQKNLQNAKELFESYLNESINNNSWEDKNFVDICEISSKLIDPRKSEYQNLIHIGAGNIETKTGVLLGLKTAKEENLISGKFLFDESTVLYSKIRPYLIKVVNCDFIGLCSADIYPLKPFKNMVIKDFLYFVLLSKRFTEYAILGSQRAGMPKVNRDHLFSYKLKIPPLEEQLILVEKFNRISSETKAIESKYQQKLRDLEELKKSVLNKAFAGEL